MANLFGLDIAGIVNSSIASAGGVLDATLVKVSAGSRTSGSLTDGTNPTEQTLRCKGFYDDHQLRKYPETRVQAGDRMAVLLGASIPGRVAPVPGDEITMDGETNEVQSVERDPASATYACHVRNT